MLRRKRLPADGTTTRQVRPRPTVYPAMPFVEFCGGKFSVNSEAEAFLRSLGDQKLAVATVAGPYRHGKSFLLKRVILEQAGAEGFQALARIAQTSPAYRCSGGSLDDLVDAVTERWNAVVD